MNDQTIQAPASRSIKGFLIDIDGVLYVEKQLIRGALEAIEYLQKSRIPFLLVTNTTRRSRYSLHTNLQRMGFKLDIKRIYTAPYAAARWLKERNVHSITLLLRGDSYREFKDFRITTSKPEYIVIGDIGEDMTYNMLNQAFRLVMSGARMLALQKNRYWMRGDGLAIDTGAIVAALEYATNKRATVVGKPSSSFFKSALKEIGLPAEHIAIIGDDLESDIKGGAQMGFYAIAVQTGKFSAKKLPPRSKLPHHTLPSIAELPEWLEAQGKFYVAKET